MSCLNQEQLNTLLCGAPPLEERIAMLEHVSACETCAEALANRTTALPRVEPPAGMRSQTLSKAQVKTKQERESLGRYSLRVLAAMAAALVLLFSGAFRFLGNLPEELSKAREGIQAITQYFDFNFAKEDTHAPEST